MLYLVPATGFQLRLTCPICDQANLSVQTGASFRTAARRHLVGICGAEWLGVCTLNKLEVVLMTTVTEGRVSFEVRFVYLDTTCGY